MSRSLVNTANGRYEFYIRRYAESNGPEQRPEQQSLTQVETYGRCFEIHDVRTIQEQFFLGQHSRQ